MDASLLAKLVRDKCALALPLDRERRELARMGLDVPDKTLQSYWAHTTDLLDPIADAQLSVVPDRAWLSTFFSWHNDQHQQAGLALFTPAEVFFGRVPAVHAVRQAALDAAYALHSERFPNGPPQAALPRKACTSTRSRRWSSPSATTLLSSRTPRPRLSLPPPQHRGRLTPRRRRHDARR